MNERITNVDDKIQYVDISQSATRLPTSTRGSQASIPSSNNMISLSVYFENVLVLTKTCQVTPTILPGSKLWHVGRKRLLLGRTLT